MKAQAWIIMLWLVTLGPVAAHAQGFGLLQKKNVTINRLLPPTVNLKGKRIRVEATADSLQKDGDQLRTLLKTKLVTMIQKDPRFILNETSPETILKFSITNYYIEQVDVGTGTNRTVSNRGKIEVAYQAIDVATGAALDSENLTQNAGYDLAGGSVFDGFHVNKKKQAAEVSANETRDQLVSGIVDGMARRIAPLDQPFDAPLPAGKMSAVAPSRMQPSLPVSLNVSAWTVQAERSTTAERVLLTGRRVARA